MVLERMIPQMIANELDVMLYRGAIKRELIITSERTRRIGKTTALVNFAKKYNLGVIVHNDHIARHFRAEFNYPHIYGIDNFLRGNSKMQYVIDEGVDPEYIKKEFGVEIVTGFKYVGGI
jgi:hypothetical protein